jgi:hypothetical protein
MDVRSKKNEPFAQSEDQEDELLSIVAIKGYVRQRSRSFPIIVLFVVTSFGGWCRENGDIVD